MGRGRDESAEALLVLEVLVTLAHRKRIGELAITQCKPSMFLANSSDAGGSRKLRINVADTWPQVPSFIDQILKGAKPGDLPVEIITWALPRHQQRLGGSAFGKSAAWIDTAIASLCGTPSTPARCAAGQP